MNKKISVIVPVYNTRMEYLNKCLHSLVMQTYPETEILVVDDGSKQEHRDGYDALKKLDDRISVLHKSNGGVSSARNFAMDQACGEYVAFVDSDDWVEPTYLETLVRILEESEAELSVCDLVYEWPDGRGAADEMQDKTVKVCDRKEIFRELLLSGQVGGFLCNKLFKKELMQERLDEKLHYSEDFVFTASYCRQIGRAAVTNEKLYHYRQDQSSACGTLTYNDRIFSLLNSYEKIKEIYSEQAPEYVEEIEKNILKIALNLRSRYKLCRADQKEQYQVILQTIRRYLKKVMLSRKTALAVKANILVTWTFPCMMFRIKNLILKRNMG